MSLSANSMSNPITVLLIEDNLGDARLVQEAFREQDADCDLRYARDGAEAITLLKDDISGNRDQQHLPDLILLDLNQPKKSGLEVLSFVKSDSTMKQIPVIVLTSSEAEQDVSAAYENHANCFISKPSTLDEFIQVIKMVNTFWLTLAKLPTRFLTSG